MEKALYKCTTSLYFHFILSTKIKSFASSSSGSHCILKAILVLYLFGFTEAFIPSYIRIVKLKIKSDENDAFKLQGELINAKTHNTHNSVGPSAFNTLNVHCKF